MSRSKPSDAEVRVRVPLTRDQRDLLIDIILAPVHLMRLIRVAPVEHGCVQIRLTLEQLDELVQRIEENAEKTTNKKAQKELYDLSDYLEQFRGTKTSGMDASVDHLHLGNEGWRSSEDSILKLTAGQNRSIPQIGPPSNSCGHMPAPNDLRDFLVKFLEHQGRIPRSEIGGLAPEHLNKLLQSDWDDSLGVMRFKKDFKFKELQKAQILHKARTFLGAVIECGGVKATVAGNLNRKFIALMLERMTWPDAYLDHLHKMNKVINEQDVFPLHVVRILLDLSGLLVLEKGVFSPTDKGEYLLREGKAGLLYHLLFKTFFQEIDLAYLDRLAAVPRFQDTIPYSLFMLSKVNRGWKRTDELAPLLVLPMVKQEMESTGVEVHWFLFHRLFRPLEDFGLLQRRDLPKHEADLGVDEVHKTGLFDRFISFHFEE